MILKEMCMLFQKIRFSVPKDVPELKPSLLNFLPNTHFWPFYDPLFARLSWNCNSFRLFDIKDLGLISAPIFLPNWSYLGISILTLFQFFTSFLAKNYACFCSGSVFWRLTKRKVQIQKLQISKNSATNFDAKKTKFKRCRFSKEKEPPPGHLQK